MKSDLETGEYKFLFAKSPKIWCVRKWRSLPRFFKLYIIFAVVVVTFVLSLVTLTGTLPFVSSLSPKSELVKSPPTENIVNLKEPLIAAPAVQEGHPPNPLPKPDHRSKETDADSNGRENRKENEDELFNFHPENDKFEISYQRDLLHAEHTPKQKVVIEAMKHSWNGYRDFAWGADHLRPMTKGKQNWFNVGLTILDSLDTLLLMGMEKEFKDALDWIENQLSFDIYKEVNCFEMTIRVLGGLESSFHMTKRPVLLAKAVDVGDRLIHCFDSPSHLVPYSDVNLRTKTPKAPAWSPDSSLSEVSTVQLEFRDLSRLIKDSKFEEISFKTSKHIHEMVQKEGPLLPMYINPNTGHFTPSTITLGARGDSYYEYLLKQFLQTGIDWLQDDYLNAVDAIKARLIKTTKGPKKLTYVAEILRKSTDFSPKMDHLVCFLPGTLALGYYHYSQHKSSYRGHDVVEANNGDQGAWPERYADHLQLAEDLARTCYEMYNMTATGLSPEIVYFGVSYEDEEEIYVRPADTHNLLRPEYVESLFYLYHITGNEMYRDQGSKILDSFNKYSRVPSGGYTTLDDVRHPDNTRPKNMQESFWLAETLKYLFLLFSDDKQLISKILNNYVFNTEAHLIPIKHWN